MVPSGTQIITGLLYISVLTDPTYGGYEIKNGACYWYLNDVLSKIKNKGIWVSDCAGFQRLLLRIANPNLTEDDYNWGLKFKDTTTVSNLLPGDKMFGLNSVTGVQHVMTYLYTDSSGNTYVMDQGSIRVGIKSKIENYVISSYYEFTYN